jgi:hypothetical protein
MRALSGHVQGELCGAVHIGVKRALAVVASHYEIDLGWVCEGYVLPDEPELADAKMRWLTNVVKGQGLLWLTTSRPRWFCLPHRRLLSYPLLVLLRPHKPDRRPAGFFEIYVNYAKNLFIFNLKL